MTFPRCKSARVSFHVHVAREKPRRNRLAPNRSIPPFPCSTESHHEKSQAEGGFRSGPTGSVSLSPPIGHINHIANDAAPLFIYSPSFSLILSPLFLYPGYLLRTRSRSIFVASSRFSDSDSTLDHPYRSTPPREPIDASHSHLDRRITNHSPFPFTGGCARQALLASPI